MELTDSSPPFRSSVAGGKRPEMSFLKVMSKGKMRSEAQAPRVIYIHVNDGLAYLAMIVRNPNHRERLNN